MDNTMDMLKANVTSVVETLETASYMGECEECDRDGACEDHPSAESFLADALDITHMTNGMTGDYLGSEIAVTLGGPNIVVDTRHGVVTGRWGRDYYEARYDDHLGVDSALEYLASAL